MYKRRRRRHIVMPVLAGLLTLAGDAGKALVSVLLGRLLLAAVADKARAQGARTLELGAQYDKQGFYEAVGFAPYGEPYLDEGYPHVPMRMAL